MSRLIRCDRCGVTHPMPHPVLPGDWAAVEDPNSPPSSFGGFLEYFEVCPECQTPEERANVVLQEAANAVADQEEGEVA